MKTSSFRRTLRAPMISVAIAISAAISLSACGGGGSDSSAPPVVVNPPVTPPVVVDPPVVVPPVVVPPVVVEPPVVAPPVVVEPPVVVVPPVVVEPPVVVAPPVTKPGGSPLNPVPAVIGDDNVAPIYVDAGAFSNVKIPNAIYVDVKVCSPSNPASCAVIDHVLVDTGSVGLRLFADAAPSALLAGLPNATSGGEPLGECLSFVSGTTWGSVRKADIRMGGVNQSGKMAVNMSIQIIGDTGAKFADVPASCQGLQISSAAQMGAKGIIGIGLFAQDCGSACTVFAPPVYFSCAQAPCRQIQVPLADQVANPIIGFGADNNGNILVLPSLPNRVAARADGMLIFGLGTRSNNALPSGSSVLAANSLGYFSSQFNGSTLPNSLIDSGSSVNFFPAQDGAVKFNACPGGIASFLCAGSNMTITAANSGSRGTSSTIPVFVVDGLSAFTANPQGLAFEGLAGPSQAPYQTLFLGASFFYGRSVGLLIEERSAVGISFPGPAFTHTQ